MKPSNKTLFTIFFVVFLDLLGLTIAIPVITPLFIDHSFGLFGTDISFKMRTFLLGCIVALYPLMQLFGAPLIGRWSDKVGRKKALIFSLVGTFLGHIMFAVGVMMRNIPMIFASRAIDGVTAGNISVVQSIIADVSSPEDKVKNFGIVGVGIGLGLVLGPALGGVLSDSTLVPWFGPALPFIVASLLAVLNVWFVEKYISETLHHKPTKTLLPELNFKASLKAVFSNTAVRSLYVTTFLFMSGFTFYTQFFQVFAIDRLSLSQSSIGYVFAFVGVCIVLVQGVVVRLLPKKWKIYNIPFSTLLLLGLVLIVMSSSTELWHILMLVPFISVGIGMSMPNIKAMLSNAAQKGIQGEVLGIEQSLNSLANIFPPIIAGVIAGINPNLPMIAAGVVVLLAWMSYVRSRRLYLERYLHN